MRWKSLAWIPFLLVLTAFAQQPTQSPGAAQSPFLWEFDTGG